LFNITNAAITPGTQPQKVKSSTIKKEPQPLPKTAKGGKNMASNTRIKLICHVCFMIDVSIRRTESIIVTNFYLKF